MKIGIICGSHRVKSQSGKVARFIQARLGEQKFCSEAWLLDLAGNPLPLWEETIWTDDADWRARLAPLSEQLAASDGFVVVTPEWHGMAPAGLKNFFLMWGKGELAHKPALLVAVSAGAGGAYPIAELRMSSYKNNRICYLPEHFIVRNAEQVLNDSPAETAGNAKEDAYLRERLQYALGILGKYAEALAQVRASEACSVEKFKNGM